MQYDSDRLGRCQAIYEAEKRLRDRHFQRCCVNPTTGFGTPWRIFGGSFRQCHIAFLCGRCRPISIIRKGDACRDHKRENLAPIRRTSVMDNHRFNTDRSIPWYYQVHMVTGTHCTSNKRTRNKTSDSKEGLGDNHTVLSLTGLDWSVSSPLDLDPSATIFPFDVLHDR
jgi:hypothetical protein